MAGQVAADVVRVAADEVPQPVRHEDSAQLRLDHGVFQQPKDSLKLLQSPGERFRIRFLAGRNLGHDGKGVVAKEGCDLGV